MCSSATHPECVELTFPADAAALLLTPAACAFVTAETRVPEEGAAASVQEQRGLQAAIERNEQRAAHQLLGWPHNALWYQLEVLVLVLVLAILTNDERGYRLETFPQLNSAKNSNKNRNYS
jgi:hypothetical protein